jgi:hypothetical protein
VNHYGFYISFQFIFFIDMNFELVPGTFFSQSSRSFTGADRLRRLEQMVGKDGWNEWKRCLE